MNNNKAYLILVIYFCYESQTAQFSPVTTPDVLTTESTLEHEILQNNKAFNPLVADWACSRPECLLPRELRLSAT